ncbi:MAG: alkaline phosphatase D family protein [Candidatus Parcubacteria bacterium]|nr:alkaline phosphatase D family protein [Burkholderiales bacterium]
MFDRRRFLQALAALGVSQSLRANAQLLARPRFAFNPFSLGVASGYPLPQGVVLWTRLAPVPGSPGGGLGPEVIPVGWEVARDQQMKSVVASGTAHASADWAHSVHVEVTGLEAARSYWYRFTAGEAQSPIGRTRTAPGFTANPQRLRLGLASCQHYEQGFFGAYRHLVADDPDLILFVGDYIYESSWGGSHVRKHGSHEPHSLDDYRARYALYRSDPDLQAAHAACPWISTWDDHEVENDYANDRSENLDSPEWFLARRAAAYKAYYEHLPMRREMLPFGPQARIYTRAAFGNLVNLFVLDDRQYRAPQVCPRPGRGGSNTVDVAECRDLLDPARSMLGRVQESWLDAGLSASRTKWNLLVQQTPMAQFDQKPGVGRIAWTDGWDGYPVARRRLLESIQARKVPNPVVLGGDVHSFNVNELKTDFDDPASPVMASEFVGTSITSQAWPQERLNAFLPDNPHMKLVDSRYRGYLRLDLSPTQLRADLRAMESVARTDAACSTLASFVVEDGRPGPQKA